jgi:hypothetical protein
MTRGTRMPFVLDSYCSLGADVDHFLFGENYLVLYCTLAGCYYPQTFLMWSETRCDGTRCALSRHSSSLTDNVEPPCN